MIAGQPRQCLRGLGYGVAEIAGISLHLAQRDRVESRHHAAVLLSAWSRDEVVDLSASHAKSHALQHLRSPLARAGGKAIFCRQQGSGLEGDLRVCVQPCCAQARASGSKLSAKASTSAALESTTSSAAATPPPGASPD